jgi:hypothetical protein
MKTNKTIVFGLLAVFVASMIFVAGAGITSAYAQASNVTSKAVAPSSMQGTVVRDSAVILLEGKTIPANDYIHLYDTTPYMIKTGHIAAKLPCDASSTTIDNTTPIALSTMTMFSNTPVTVTNTPISTGSLVFAGSALLFHNTDAIPFTVTYTIDAVAKPLTQK